ncbi:Chain length determinant protein [Daejeonella rubra]|uniref:Chain length determinant protein n=1 Tax=Daejeonella rubra TaxID=990371 RepID=A0A1G9WUA5_9SPHI|nr:lipopolysaccharide biosynthesis protein [Daejeonella rubra]SDM87683.1 Chain length determinant protein [Daejeonella rubra]
MAHINEGGFVETTTLSNNLYSDDSSEMSFKEIVFKMVGWVKYLWTKWLIILIVGLIGGGIGFYKAFVFKPVYIAEYSFVLEDEKSGGLGGAFGLASQFGIDIGGGGGGAFSGDNLLELMRSRSMVQKALLKTVSISGKQQALVDYYIDYKDLREVWKEKAGLNEMLKFPLKSDPKTFTRIQDSLLMSVHNDIVQNFLSVAKIDRKLSIIKVEVKSQNENFSKHFAEALVDEVSRFYIETKTLKSSRNVQILQHKVDSVRQRLNSAISGVALSNDMNPNANPSRMILRAPSQQKQIDVQANTAILTQLVTNLEISKLTLSKETPLIQVIDRPTFPLKKERMGKLKSLITGGILGGFFIVALIVGRKILWDLLK